MPFWICRLGAGSCGNTRAELAPTRHGLNLPRHGVETAFAHCIRGIGFTQSGMPAKAAGRSIKRMVQPRKLTPDGYSWESPGAG
ncbi:MAG: hypothetical protein JRI35_06955 [Deltaproteobacteria bacterium]|nr:hypothetical protein [Deltaproteobacteria bacterium]